MEKPGYRPFSAKQYYQQNYHFIYAICLRNRKCCCDRFRSTAKAWLLRILMIFLITCFDVCLVAFDLSNDANGVAK